MFFGSGRGAPVSFWIPPTLTPVTVGMMAAFEAGGFIDAGDPAICDDPRVQGVDQSGLARPVGAACDVGAFEYYGGFTP